MPFPEKAEKINRIRFRQIFSFITLHSNIYKLFNVNALDRRYFKCEKIQSTDIELIEKLLDSIKNNLILDNHSNFEDSYRTFNDFKDLRNDIEHFSSRLIAKISQTGNLSTFKWCTNSSLYAPLANGTTADDYLRVYNHESECFYFKGVKYDFKAAESDLTNLINKIKSIIHWLG